MDPATCSGRASTRSRRSSTWATWCTRGREGHRINEQNCRVYGVLDDRFQRVPAEENPLGLGGRNTLTRWPADASWQFVAVGRGHDQDFWARFLRALTRSIPDMAVNIEHEDTELDSSRASGWRRRTSTRPRGGV
jgi:hypothetical protein